MTSYGGFSKTSKALFILCTCNMSYLSDVQGWLFKSSMGNLVYVCLDGSCQSMWAQQTSFSPWKRLLRFVQVPYGSSKDISLSSVTWICKRWCARWYKEKLLCFALKFKIVLNWGLSRAGQWVAQWLWHCDEEYKPSVFMAHNALCLWYAVIYLRGSHTVAWSLLIHLL